MGTVTEVTTSLTLNHSKLFTFDLADRYVRLRWKIIGNLGTMRDSDLPTVLIISLPIIFKRTVASTVCFLRRRDAFDDLSVCVVHRLLFPWIDTLSYDVTTTISRSSPPTFTPHRARTPVGTTVMIDFEAPVDATVTVTAVQGRGTNGQ